MLGKMKNMVGGIGGSLKNFDPTKFAHKGTTEAFASASNYANTALKRAGNVASNGAANDNFVVGIAKGIDSSLGGHGQMLYAQAKELAENTNLTKGILPGADEFKQVKRTFSGDPMKQQEVASALSNSMEAFSQEQQALGVYKKALQDAGYNMQDEGVINAMKNQKATIGGKEMGFDFSGYGSTQDVIDEAMSTRYNSLKDMNSSLKSDLSNVQQGFMMQDQSALEKAQTYFSNGEYGKKRMAAAGIGVAGVAVGGRLASGGSLTRDAEGRRDIVGVPFI